MNKKISSDQHSEETNMGGGDSRPIGVFDSGIGGLTVLRELVKKFPKENFIYLGDLARLPYGSKSPQTVRKYSEQNIEFLISQNVKTVVIACNTASAQFFENSFKDRPIYNVIGPGSELAVLKTQNKRIGVIATRATVKSKAYETQILKQDPAITVNSVACPLFVPLAEEGWFSDPVTNIIAYRYLQNLKQMDVDTVVLGCTHYPLLKESIRRVFGNHVFLVDSGEAISTQLEGDLKSGKIIKNLDSNVNRLRICLTDQSAQFEGLALELLEHCDHDISFETVSVT